MTPLAKPMTEKVLEQLRKQDAVTFQDGLPGFPEEKRFALLQTPEERPFIWMQSLTDPKLCFIVTSPFVFFPDYRPDVSEEELSAIGNPSSEQLMLVTIVWFVTHSNPEVHTNLKAPIVINLKNFQARQVILNNEAMYSERAVYRVKSDAA